MSNNAPLLPFTINTRAGLAGARPADRRCAGARHGHELPGHVAPGQRAVLQRPLSAVPVRQPDVAVSCRQWRELRHRDRRAEHRERAVQPDAPYLRWGRDLFAVPLRGLPCRLHARGGRSDVPHRGEDERRHRPCVDRPDGRVLGDGARRLRARAAPRNAGGRNGAPRDRRAAEPADSTTSRIATRIGSPRSSR